MSCLCIHHMSCSNSIHHMSCLSIHHMSCSNSMQCLVMQSLLETKLLQSSITCSAYASITCRAVTVYSVWSWPNGHAVPFRDKNVTVIHHMSCLCIHHMSCSNSIHHMSCLSIHHISCSNNRRYKGVTKRSCSLWHLYIGEGDPLYSA